MSLDRRTAMASLMEGRDHNLLVVALHIRQGFGQNRGMRLGGKRCVGKRVMDIHQLCSN